MKDLEWLKGQVDSIHFYEGKGTPRTNVNLVEEILELIDQVEQPELPEITEGQAWEVLSNLYDIPNHSFIRATMKVVAKNIENTTTIAEIKSKFEQPETLSQEWIDEHEEMVVLTSKGHDDFGNVYSAGTMAKGVPSGKLKNLLVPKQELPVIPQFVAEYLDFAKSDVPLMRVMELAKTRNEWPKWEKEYDWISANDEKFARAWLDGYTVEEKGYKVLGKGRESILLVKDRHGEVVEASDLLDEEYTWISSEVLTEQEIKDYDERYWPFAKEVTE